MNVDQRLAELYIDLPEPRTELSGAVTRVGHGGKLLFVGGQLPWVDGKLGFSGRVGLDTSLDNGKQAAKAALIQALAALHAYLGGSLTKIKQILLLRGSVAAGNEFKEHEKVMESASELLVGIFGPAGVHARSVVGVTSLPYGASVAVELVVEIN